MHVVSARTAAKWVRRYCEIGAAGLRDRSSRPHRLRQPTSPALVEQVKVLRRERWTGQRIARQIGLSRATVSRILRRLKLSRISDLEPKPPVLRYEHAAAGDMLHLDIKKLGRIVRPSHRVTGNRRDSVDGAGWEYVPVAIDDHSRIAFSAIYQDETRASVLRFLAAALGLLRPARHPLQGRTHRQRAGLSLARVRRCLPRARPQAPLHPSLHTAHQR